MTLLTAGIEPLKSHALSGADAGDHETQSLLPEASAYPASAHLVKPVRTQKVVAVFAVMGALTSTSIGLLVFRLLSSLIPIESIEIYPCGFVLLFGLPFFACSLCVIKLTSPPWPISLSREGEMLLASMAKEKKIRVIALNGCYLFPVGASLALYAFLATNQELLRYSLDVVGMLLGFSLFFVYLILFEIKAVVDFKVDVLTAERVERQKKVALKRLGVG